MNKKNSDNVVIEYCWGSEIVKINIMSIPYLPPYALLTLYLIPAISYLLLICKEIIGWWQSCGDHVYFIQSVQNIPPFEHYDVIFRVSWCQFFFVTHIETIKPNFNCNYSLFSIHTKAVLRYYCYMVCSWPIVWFIHGQ